MIISCILLLLREDFGLTTEVDLSPNVCLLLNSFPFSYLLYKMLGSISTWSANNSHQLKRKRKNVSNVNSYLTDLADFWTIQNSSDNVRQVLGQEDMDRN